MGVDFEHPDGDDDVQVRSLNVPVLEVYAPVRQKGTGRIIAIAETYELAVLLTNEVWTDQLTTWASAGAIVLMIDLLLFNMLSRLRVESDQQRRRITHANMRLGEKNEESLRSVEAGLHEGPIQNVTFALLKLDPFHPAVRDNNDAQAGTTTQFIEDLVAAREALNRTIARMREISTVSVSARVVELPAREALAAAAREHHRRTGFSVQYDFDSLPDQLPSFLKVSLYRILLEGLRCTAGGVKLQLVRGSAASNRVALEIVGTTGGKDYLINLASIRDRIEALGGTLEVHSADHGQLSLAAEVNLADLGTANG
jgi:signal transduction histidine kinase